MAARSRGHRPEAPAVRPYASRASAREATLLHYVADRLPRCRATFYPDEDHRQPRLRHVRDILQALMPSAMRGFGRETRPIRPC
jgi:hypothetical protein